MTKSRFDCKEDGCTRSAQAGDMIMRTSPKGELFEGKCIEHAPADNQPDAVEHAIADAARRGTR